MWHASVCYHRRGVTLADVEARARRVLRGVGDPMLGEWVEGGRGAGPLVHLRRRLTDLEWDGKPWGIDLRRTSDGDRRLETAGCRPEWAPDEWSLHELASACHVALPPNPARAGGARSGAISLRQRTSRSYATGLGLVRGRER